MHQHLAIVLEGEEFLVEERVNMNRQQYAVVAVDAFGIAGFPPGFENAAPARGGPCGPSSRLRQETLRFKRLIASSVFWRFPCMALLRTMQGAASSRFDSFSKGGFQGEDLTFSVGGLLRDVAGRLRH
ncbi:MAG: hypothetical protein WB784_08395 [Rhodanobacteraceae bacterium]